VEVVRVDELTRADVPAGRPRAEDATEGFDALFAREFPRVARTIHHVLGDRARAEEVTQDAFLELLRHWSKVAAYDRPDLWVRRVAIRKAQRERHRAWRRVELERSASPDGSVEPPTPAPEVLAAVRRLAPKQRAVVVLFYFEDRPMAEIAEILECSESTGWSQLHTARRRLASALGEEVTDDVR
jgi:RNA polymerase sigma-70 factor (ECF subfamily)